MIIFKYPENISRIESFEKDVQKIMNLKRYIKRFHRKFQSYFLNLLLFASSPPSNNNKFSIDFSNPP